jgi:hypothetical protein
MDNNPKFISWQIWRCYLVWDQNPYIVSLPILLLLGSTGALVLRAPSADIHSRFSFLATGVGILYSFERVVPQANIFVIQLQQWIIAFFSTALATNLIGTG